MDCYENHEIWIVHIIRSFPTKSLEEKPIFMDGDETRAVFPDRDKAFSFARQELENDFCIDSLEVYTLMDEMLRNEQ